MAEIRSTLEMVLERAAKMSQTALAGTEDEGIREGMRLGAGYLRGDDINLSKALDQHDEAEKTAMLKGVIQALLRNIVLPREKENQADSEKAMQGLIEMGRADPELIGILSEMKTFLDRYLDHKKQLRQQLEESFAQQIGQLEQNLTQQTGTQLKLEPSQHPKFAEEWQRLSTELNDQYGQALDQHKNMIKQILTAA
ncbi:MAG: DUF6657 family protein [Thermodesulfobacteriota bacterium]|nr:DUF6657 family protein [Thermodesulfobacteriota bacterium]